MLKVEQTLRLLVLLCFGSICVCPQSRKDSLSLADSLLQSGYAEFKVRNYPSAISFWESSSNLFIALGERKAALVLAENLALASRAVQDSARYETYLSQQMELARGLQNNRSLSAACSALGKWRGELGNYEESERYFLSSQTIFESDTSLGRKEFANMLSNYATLRGRRNDYAGSLTLLRRALEMRPSDDNTVASDLAAMALAYMQLGRYDSSGTVLEKAFQLKNDDGVVLSRLWLYSGNRHSYLGRHDKALADYRQAAEVADRVRHRTGYADAMVGMGTVYHNQGQFQLALDMYRKALELHESSRATRSMAKDLTNIGLIYLTVNDLEEAEKHIQQAIRIEKGIGDRFGLASDLAVLASIAWQKNNLAKAESYLREALEIRRGVGDVRGESNDLIQLAAIQLNRKESRERTNDEDVLATIQQAIEKKKLLQDRYGQVTTLSYAGQYYRLQGDYARSVSYMKEASTLAEQLQATTLQWQTLYGLGKTYEKMAQHADAVSAYQSAVRLIENQRVDLKSEQFRIGYFESKDFVYTDLVASLVRQGLFAEALQAVESSRGRSFLDILGTRAAKQQDHAILQSLDSIDSKLAAVDEKYKEGLALSEYEMSMVPQWRARRQQLLNDLNTTHEELSSLVSVSPLKVHEIQELLDPDVTLIEYYVSPSFTSIFSVTRTDIRCEVVAQPSLNILIEALEFRQNLLQAGKNRYEASARKVYDLIFNPIRSAIRTSKVIIVPHGKLHYIPFGALMDSAGTFLIDSYEISYLPSASLLKYVSQKRKTGLGFAQSDLFAAANPKVPELTPLPGAEEEVATIAQFFQQKNVRVGDQATETVVYAETGDKDIIHFACHGKFELTEPEKSALYLTRDKQNDGRLTVREIFGMKLDKAQLVVLSACETGLSKILKGDELIGFSRAFIYAGSPSLISSLWPVSDESTALQMRTLYLNLQSLPKGKALREAQKAVRAKFNHPYYWSPFVLVGDWR